MKEIKVLYREPVEAEYKQIKVFDKFSKLKVGNNALNSEERWKICSMNNKYHYMMMM